MLQCFSWELTHSPRWLSSGTVCWMWSSHFWESTWPVMFLDWRNTQKKNSQAVPIGKLQIPDVASFLPKHVITTYYQHNTRWTIYVIDWLPRPRLAKHMPGSLKRESHAFLAELSVMKCITAARSQTGSSFSIAGDATLHIDLVFCTKRFLNVLGLLWSPDCSIE